MDDRSAIRLVNSLTVSQPPDRWVFQRHVLDVLEKRRDQIVSRAAILLAANATLFAGALQLGVNTTIRWLDIAARLGLLVCIALNAASVITGLQMIHVIRRRSTTDGANTDAGRGNDLLSYDSIAAMQVSEYADRIANLSVASIEAQYTSQIVSLSRLLTVRYKRLALAYWLFLVGLIVFLCVSTLRLFPPPQDSHLHSGGAAAVRRY
jgi:hypothetical protein